MPYGGNDWLALTQEPTLEPELPICDPHHHFWDFRTERIPEFIPITPSAATGSGAPGNYAGHNRVPSPDRGYLFSINGSGLSRRDSA
jgi:hypothetical protein